MEEKYKLEKRKIISVVFTKICTEKYVKMET